MGDYATQQARAQMAEIREKIAAAKASGDVVACCEAIESFFEFFATHTHTWDEPNSDPYNPFRNTRETDGPVGG